MKKIILNKVVINYNTCFSFCIVVLFLIFFSFSSAHASSCAQYSSTTPVPKNFGVSYNLFSAQKELLIKTDCTKDQVSVDIGNGQAVQYIYRYGYIWRDAKWKPVELLPVGTANAYADWLIGKAKVDITLSEDEMLKDNYFLTYICYWNGTTWKCGCHDQLCSNNYWQLQKFKYISGTCTENWTCGNWSACANSSQTRICTDQNKCGITTSKPAESQTCVTACTENWICGEWGSCQNGNQTRICTDQNKCGTTAQKPTTSQNCSGVTLCQDSDGDSYDNCDLGISGGDGKTKDCNDNEKFAYPGGTETCDKIDNNCDGQTDEGCDDDKDGYCDQKMKIYRNNSMCIKTQYFEGVSGNDCDDVKNMVNPGVSEVCGNQIDDNCNGQSDENCFCTNGQTRECGTSAVGACKKGIETCANNQWGTCVGEVLPKTEICGNGIDEDCNGSDMICEDTTKPVVNSFSITPLKVEEGNTVNISYSVSDNKVLARIELWRTTSTISCVTGKETQCVWTKQTEKSLSGTSSTGVLNDLPKANIYWYGLHVVDANNNVGYESSSFGAIKIEITAKAVCTENWICAEWGVCTNNIQTRTCEDQNICGTTTKKPTLSQTCTSGCINDCNVGEKGCLGENISWTCGEMNDGDNCLEKINKFCDREKEEICNAKTSTCEVINTLYSHINAPQNNQEFASGQLIYFSTYTQFGTAPYVYEWKSNISGIIRNTDNFSIDSLPIGNHIITLTVNDALGAKYQEIINISIKDEIIINFYNESNSFYFGKDVWFYTQVFGGTEPYTYRWESDRDGLLSDKASFSKNNLSLGIHKITLTVNDNYGNISSKYYNLEIKASICIDKDKDGFGANTITSNDTIGGLNENNYIDFGCPQSLFDCNDNNFYVNPATAENCKNGIDDNCDGFVDECDIKYTIFTPAENASLNWGSEINFRLDFVNNIDRVTAKIYDVNNNYKKSFSLYDDGKHNDLLANDEKFGAVMFNLLSNGSYKIKLEAMVPNSNKYFPLDKDLNVNISSTPQCTTVVNNGPSEDKWDLVYISDRYTDFNAFGNLVKNAKDYLFTIKPFDVQMSKVNVHRIDSPVNLYCASYGSTSPTANKYCSYSYIYEIASLCPNDSPVVFPNTSGRSWAYFNTLSIVFGGSSVISVHELGHSFAGLADEYEESGKPTATSTVSRTINCDIEPTCQKWAGVAGAGCFNGCNYNLGFYRSISSGIMRSNSSKDFGIININHINSLFDKYK